MKRVKITVKRIVVHQDLCDEYENPMENACDSSLCPPFPFAPLQGARCTLRDSSFSNASPLAFERKSHVADASGGLTAGKEAECGLTMSPFVMTLAYGGQDIYSGWMKNKKSAMVSCNDGFRPVSFLLEALDEAADEYFFGS